MADFREFDDVQYVAGRNFQSEYGHHEAGSIVKEAREFQNLTVLVDAHVLYPYAPDKGYEFLPAHIFNSIETRDEVMAKLEGAAPQNPDHFRDGRKPDAMVQAEREADQQLQAYASTTNKGEKSELVTKTQEFAEKQAATQTRALANPDVNPNVKDKADDLNKMRDTDDDDLHTYDLIAEEGVNNAKEAREEAKKAREDLAKEQDKLLKKQAKNEEKRTQEDNEQVQKEPAAQSVPTNMRSKLEQEPEKKTAKKTAAQKKADAKPDTKTMPDGEKEDRNR